MCGPGFLRSARERLLTQPPTTTRYRLGLNVAVVAIILMWCWTATTSLFFGDALAAIGESFWGLFNSAMIYGTIVLAMIAGLL